jgi:hypothetical protein
LWNFEIGFSQRQQTARRIAARTALVFSALHIVIGIFFENAKAARSASRDA